MKNFAILFSLVLLSSYQAVANQDDPIFELECFYQEHFFPTENSEEAVFSSDKIVVRRLSGRDDDRELGALQYRDTPFYLAFAAVMFGGIGGEPVTKKAGDTVTLNLSIHDKSVPDFGRMKSVYMEIRIVDRDAQLSSKDYASLSFRLPEFPSTMTANQVANTLQISCATRERSSRDPLY